MQGIPPFTEQRREAAPASQWSAGLGTSLRKAEVLHHGVAGGLKWELRRTPSCVWLILTASAGIRIGIRSVFCPTGLTDVKLLATGHSHVQFLAQGGTGRYRVRAHFMEGGRPMLRVTTELTPTENLRVTAAPRDLCVLDSRLNPYRGEGRLYTCQTGGTAGQSFFSTLEDKGATVFYLQNFTALAGYFNQTGAVLAGAVQGEWPEAGFGLPAGEKPLKKGKPVVIADVFMEVAPGVVAPEAGAGLMFLEALARVYLQLSHPVAAFSDWPEAARKTLRSLTGSRHCSRIIDRKLFIEAYVGSSYKPPESMVQGALIVPLMEYARWQQRPEPLLKKLAHAPESFFDAKLKIPLRWLPGAPFTKEETSEEEQRFRMDSWYLLHTLMNLGRMAELGMEKAGTVFENSLPTIVRIARHFNYDWPVFYDQRNLQVFKQETQEGEGGERDASGLYIHVMIQAHRLTHDPLYLKEAEAAAGKLKGLGFGVLYQTNNTVIGAVALARLWRATGKSQYKDQSLVSLASTFSHLWLWSMGAGTKTYMGLPPLHNAPYLALYEEAEILAALQTYQEEMRDDLPPSLALLCAEYQKHLLARAHYYFPANLPDDGVTKEPKEGRFNAVLHIPLEGLGAPGEKAGTVGQAVYAAAAPFIWAARCWKKISGVPFTLFCHYPLFDLEFSCDRQAGRLQCRVGGSPELTCRVHIFPTGRGPAVPILKTGEDQRPRRLSRNRALAGLEAEITGGTVMSLEWTTKRAG